MLEVELVLKSASEIFGASEEEAPELDHSEDSENGLLSYVRADSVPVSVKQNALGVCKKN